MKLKHLPEVRICFVGESFINGTGDPECLGWAGRICIDAYRKGYDITYYNLGVRRETSAELKNRWFKEVTCRLSKEYDSRIVFSFGVNDTTIEGSTTRVDVTKSIKNTRKILSEAKQLYPVLMVGPPPVTDEEQNYRIANLAKHFALICHELQIPYLEVFPSLKNSNIWLNEVQGNDGAHPRAAGYKLFAELVQNWQAWLDWFPAS